MKILFVLPRSPWPPYAGQARLAFNRAKHLRNFGHEVHLFAYGFHISFDSFSNRRNLSSVYCSQKLISFGTFSFLTCLIYGFISWLFKFRPLISTLYTPHVVSNSFRQFLLASNFDIIHFYSIKSYPLWSIASAHHIPFVIDLVDSMTLNISGRCKSAPPLLRHILGRELSCVQLFEANLPVYSHCFAYIVVGLNDTSYLSLSSTSSTSYSQNTKILVHSIGVDLPTTDLSVKPPLCNEPLDILLFGSLHYHPNIEAAIWFVEHVCPILSSHFDFTFTIAGARPTKQLRDLASRHSFVRLHANPLDMPALVISSSLTIAPMLSGSGQQFKVIESLSLSTPVVATSLASKPLGLIHNHHLLVADTPVEFAASINLLLTDHSLYSRLVGSGRAYAIDKYSWSTKARDLISLYSLSKISHHS